MHLVFTATLFKTAKTGSNLNAEAPFSPGEQSAQRPRGADEWQVASPKGKGTS